jgi:hypothetical protein
MTTTYAMPHDLSQIRKKASVKPIFTEIRVKEIIPVVTMPMRRAKSILFFTAVI